MASPSVIVPPVPTVAQGHPLTPVPGDDSPGMEQVQKAFDKAYPEIRTAPTPPKSVTPPPETLPKETPEPQQPPAQEPKPVEEPVPPATQPKPEESHKLPSFLEEALQVEPSKAPAQAPAEEEWPEELPAFKTTEESKARYKKWRETYNELKRENTTLKSRPAQPDNERVNYLETQNRQMSEALSRMGVEQNVEFQQQVMQPLYASWQEATRIVKEAGGDPVELQRAMTLSGKAQFEALDTLFSDMPESAKAEAHDALRSYRRFEEARRRAVADAPNTYKELQKRELQRQQAALTKEREGMQGLFDQALKKLRDEAKVEVFQKTGKPSDKWWDEQADQLEAAARGLFLDNTDMGRVAFACLLAPAADAYRKLFITSQKEVMRLKKVIGDRFGEEPSLSESPGSNGPMGGEAQMKEDLKRPFSEVFLREFHRAQARSR